MKLRGKYLLNLSRLFSHLFRRDFSLQPQIGCVSRLPRVRGQSNFPTLKGLMPQCQKNATGDPTPLGLKSFLPLTRRSRWRRNAGLMAGIPLGFGKRQVPHSTVKISVTP
jgi:hypothetical protein